MTRLSRVRAIVVAVDQSGDALIHMLRRMGLTVTPASCLQHARRLCASLDRDLCIVVVPLATPDEVPPLDLEAAAPGRAAGIPSVIFAAATTAYLETTARRSGYATVLPLGLPPRRLHRCLRALLQRMSRAERDAGYVSAVLPQRGDAFDLGKPRLQ